MNKTPLDILREWFDGNELNKEIIEYIERGAPRSHLDALRSRYREYVNNDPRLLPPADYELRPYIPTLWQSDPAYRSGIMGSFRDFVDREEVVRTVNVLKHFLLYCHSVAIDDPLVLFLDMLSSSASNKSVALNRVRAANVLRLMLSLKELINERVVVFIEPNEYIHNRRLLLLNYQDVTELARVADFSDLPATNQAASDEEKTGELFLALKSLKFNLAASRVHAGATTVHLPFRHCEALLTKILSKTASEVVAQVNTERRQRLENATVELGYLRELLSLPVPTFGQLSPRDILAIRTGDQFTRLRQSLEEGLRELNSVGTSELGYPQKVRKIMSGSIAQSRKNLEIEVKHSALLQASQKSLRNFAISGVPTVIAAEVGGAAAAAGAFTFSEMAQLAIDWFQQREQRAAAKAYAAHALLFRPERI